MSIWNNSKITLVWYTKDPSTDQEPCTVKIDDKEILVEYDDEGVVQYRGKNNGDGHFELTSPEVDGHASLHMFPGSNVLEGSWVEGGRKGMWRILLA